MKPENKHCVSYSLYTSNNPVPVQQDSDLDLGLDNRFAMAVHLWLGKETVPQVLKIHLISRHIASDKCIYLLFRHARTFLPHQSLLLLPSPFIHVSEVVCIDVDECVEMLWPGEGFRVTAKTFVYKLEMTDGVVAKRRRRSLCISFLI